MVDDRRFAADHVTVAALLAPDAAADADVDVMQPLGLQFRRAADVVVIVGVSAVDHDIAGLEQPRDLGQDRFDHRGRNHHPDGARLGELGDEVLHAAGAGRAEADEPRHGVRVGVVDDQVVTGLHQAFDHVRAHASKSDHPELHRRSLIRFRERRPWASRRMLHKSSPVGPSRTPGLDLGGASIGRGLSHVMPDRCHREVGACVPRRFRSRPSNSAAVSPLSRGAVIAKCNYVVNLSALRLRSNKKSSNFIIFIKGPSPCRTGSPTTPSRSAIRRSSVSIASPTARRRPCSPRSRAAIPPIR